MSLVLNVEILGEFKNLTAATKGAQTSLNSLNKTTASISNKMSGALAAIGIGFSLKTAISELSEAAKAAIEDEKSQVLLAKAMKNVNNATDSQVKSVEKVITKLQSQTNVADDELRPAYAKLYRATGDVEKSTRLLTIALDASAGSGKGLDVVSQAMAKSLAGSDTALVKLIPSLKGSKDPIDDLAKAFKGAAAEAAKTDPITNLTILFGEMQEKVGMALLPSLTKLSTWLATPEGEAKINGLIELVIGLLGKFQSVVNFAIENKDTILGFATAIGAIALSVKAVNGAITLFTGLKAAFTGVTAILTGGFTAVGLTADGAALAVGRLYTALGLIAGIAGVIGLILSIPGSTAIGAEKQVESKIVPSVPSGTAPLVPGTKVPTATKGIGSVIPGTVVQQNITIKGQQSAQDIKKVLERSTKVNGTTTVFRGGL